MANPAAPYPLPQLGFDFCVAELAPPAVNNFGSTFVDTSDVDFSKSLNARDSLAKLIVLDRVLHLGMTNWRALLDRALDLGHTQLYSTGPGDLGLRKPGLRFGPVSRLPSRGAEYVKQRLMARRVACFASGVSQKTARVCAYDNVKVDCTVLMDSVTFGIYCGRRSLTRLVVPLDEVTFTDETQAADAELLKVQLVKRLAPFSTEIQVAEVAAQASDLFWGTLDIAS